MPLEIASTIADLVSTNPVGASDTPAALDDHIQLIKKVLKADALVNADIGVNVAAQSHNHTGTYQPLDGELTALAGLTSAANKVPMFSGSGTATLIDFKDEDDFASNSATAVPSQQSVKAYVDSTKITLGAAQATTSGTEVDVTGIPSTAKVITICGVGVGTNGTSNLLVQIGDSGGIETTGYQSGSANTATVATSSIGYIITNGKDATDKYDFTVTISLMNSSANTWVASSLGNRYPGSSDVVHSSGSKSLSAALDRIRLTTVNGTDAFDEGSFSVAYQ